MNRATRDPISACVQSDAIGRTALVTGGSKGLGAAIAERLLREGMSVWIMGRDAQALQARRAELSPLCRAEGQALHTLSCDLNSVAQLQAATQQLGRIDILVNNAGVAPVGVFEDFSPERWQETMQVNALSPAYLTSQLLPGMKARSFGRIVNIASIVALQGARHVAAYAASKHALLGWSRALALELSGTGVTVNTLCPGYIDTPIFARALERVQASLDLDAPSAAQALLKSAGQGRLLRPEEVAEQLLPFLGMDSQKNGEELRLCP